MVDLLKMKVDLRLVLSGFAFVGIFIFFAISYLEAKTGPIDVRLHSAEMRIAEQQILIGTISAAVNRIEVKLDKVIIYPKTSRP